MILDTIARSTAKRIRAAKENLPLLQLKEIVHEVDCDTDFQFEKQLSRPGMNFICELKKASPSKGLIVSEFPYLDIAKEYESAGAAAISVLTEPEYFLGSDKYLQEIAAEVNIPCLRKDFIIDEYQIYEAKLLKASAVLLICALLDGETIKQYIKLCDSLGLSALVEVHNENEMRSAIYANARIIGVNNRNLHDFTVDIGNSTNLRALAPNDIIFVAESGIKTAEDISVLRNNGINAVLIGETLMKAENKMKMLNELRGELTDFCIKAKCT